MVLGIAFAATLCFAYLVGRRILRSLPGRQVEVTPQGWLTVLTAVCLALLLVLNIGDLGTDLLKQIAGIVATVFVLWSMLQKALEAGGSSGAESAGALALVWVAAAVLVIATAVSACKKAFKDLKKIWVAFARPRASERG